MWKLEYYIAKFSHLALQGSQDWLEGKSISFGGSEMASVLGKSKHEKWDKLKLRKISKQYEHSDITEWGHLFEDVSKIIIREEHGTIYEFGSIPHPYYPVCYSPDGILIKEDDLILLEIKNPIMAGIHKEIKPEYIEQVYTGMDIINVKYTLFARFRFRRCPVNTSPKSPYYDRFYHKEFKKRQKDTKPLSYGYLWWDVDCDLLDLGTQDNMCSHIFKYKTKPQIYIERKPEVKKGLILMWKLFEYKYEMIPPCKDYLKNNEITLWKKYRDLYNHRKAANSNNISEDVKNLSLTMNKENTEEKPFIFPHNLFEIPWIYRLHIQNKPAYEFETTTEEEKENLDE